MPFSVERSIFVKKPMKSIISKLIYSWRLDREDYLLLLEQEILDDLLMVGYIPAYETACCILRLHGRNPSARQDSIAKKIQSSCISLLIEIAKSNNTSQLSNSRALGLIATASNQDVDLPSGIAENLVFNRESIDLASVILISFRCYRVLAKLSNVVGRSDITTPTLTSVYIYLKEKNNDIQHRAYEVMNNRPGLSCIDSRMEEVLEMCRLTLSNIYDLNFQEAKINLSILIKKYPSFLEANWLENIVTIVLSKEFVPTKNIDFTFGCITVTSPQSSLLWTVKKSITQELIDNLQSLFYRSSRGLDMDQKGALLHASYIIFNQANIQQNFLQEVLIEYNSILKMINDFDPFSMCIQNSQISSYIKSAPIQVKETSKINEINIMSKEDSYDVNIALIVGPYSPVFDLEFLIQNDIKFSNIIYKNMQSIDQSIKDSLFMQTSKFEYPMVLDSIKFSEIETSQQFYLQNIACLNTSRSKKTIFHTNQDAFINIGMYRKLFPNLGIVECYIDVRSWIYCSLNNLFGFTHSFSLNNVPELLAYLNDYIDILSAWLEYDSFDRSVIYNGDLISNKQDKIAYDDIIALSDIFKEKIWRPCSEIDIVIDKQYENEINSTQERLESFIAFK